MQVNKWLKLRVSKQLLLIILVGIVAHSSVAQAQNLNAGAVMSNMNSDQRVGYVSGVIEGLAYSRFVRDNMFGKIKDWRRIATRYDRCAHTFFSAICIAAVVLWWI